MSPSANRPGRIGLVVAIGIIALLIAGAAIMFAVNPPFQATTPAPTNSQSATPDATATPTVKPTNSATPSVAPSATPSDTATPTPEPTPTGDPVPDDGEFSAVVAPYLRDAGTGLDIIEETVAGGSFSDAQDVIVQLGYDVQRLLDNPKPSDPDTWNGVVQTYSAAIENLSQALGNSDAERTATAIESARRDLETLVGLAG